jgi:hypothetical protein
MKKAVALALLSIALAACSSAPEPATTPPSAIPPPAIPAKVADHTHLFPDDGKVSATVVGDHILDMKAMPGGSLAEYEVKGKKYRMFIIDADSTQNAAFMMLDMKGEMKKDPEYIPYMGGYFGTYGDQPFYCFAKLHYLAGIEGLPKAQADPLARELAAQLR